MKQVQLSIPTPCHEDWQAMLPEEKGRFCLSCQKTVIDFSTMSDAEVLKHIANSSKSICGNFAPDQLDRQIKELPLRKKNVFRYAWNMAAAFLIFSTKTTAQVKPAKDNIVCGPANNAQEDGIRLLRGQIVSSIILKGRVTDTLGNPVVAASVWVNDSKEGVATDKEGYFTIISHSYTYPVTLRTTSIGFMYNETIITNEKNTGNIAIQLKKDTLPWLGEVVITTVRRKKKPFLNLFKKKETPVCVKPVVEPKLTIFPNPAAVQQEVKIQLNDLALGEWQMNLYSSAGNLLLTNPVTVSSKEQTASIPSFYTKMSGLYVIELNNASLN